MVTMFFTVEPWLLIHVKIVTITVRERGGSELHKRAETVREENRFSSRESINHTQNWKITSNRHLDILSEKQT